MEAKSKGIRAWYNEDYAPWQRRMAEAAAQREEQMRKVQGHLPELQTLVGMLMDGKTKQAVDLWNRLGIHPALRGIDVAPNGDMLTVQDAAGTFRQVSIGEIVSVIEGLKQQ